ncbi:RDD family protein [Pedobacter namyangjuensis]|uniref:RDD family protein n=1 Tax=Pedobacter namyangjuensis TaxID=600626 RepID=UPI000DE26167|nr:RDD family protein [Pedobacter namyangjuensis]
MEYTVVINGKPEGPYNFEQLKGMGLRPEMFVRKPGMDDYKEAHEIAELRELFGFKHQKTAPQYFASFDQRLLASVIDYFALLVIYVIVVLFIYVFVSEKMFRIGTALGLLLLIPVAKTVYSIIAEASEKQATLGKRLLNIKVTDNVGDRITIGLSIARNLSKILSTLPVFIGYLLCFTNKKQQCLHDSLVGTLVVKDRLI